MIIIDDETRKKINALDKLLGCYTSDELQESMNGDLVAAKLKGINNNSQLLSTVVSELDAKQLAVAQLQSDMITMKADFAMLLKILNQTTLAYTTDFHNLKQKHNVY